MDYRECEWVNDMPDGYYKSIQAEASRRIPFEQRKTTKKGTIAERIVAEILNKHGYVYYKPVTSGAHLVDFFCHKENKEIICVEVKAKRRRAYKPDTGFNTRNYKEYTRLIDRHGIRVYVVFVDDFEEHIYAQWLSVLRPYADQVKNVTLFPLKKMEVVRELTEDELKELRKLTTTNHDYSNTKPFFKRA